MWLRGLLIPNEWLTRRWHGVCNIGIPRTTGSKPKVSNQLVPQSVESDKALTVQQEEIVDYILTTGKKIKEVAEDLGMNVTNVYRTLRYPHVMKELRSRTLEHLGVLAPYAARTQERLLDADSDHVRATVAENILDRHYGKPIARSQVALQGNINVLIDLG
jgi:hypothetical protein